MTEEGIQEEHVWLHVHKVLYVSYNTYIRIAIYTEKAHRKIYIQGHTIAQSLYNELHM
jgi:hypothetical protein